MTLVATWPLWSSSAFFYSDDGLLHLFRTIALDATLRDGIAYPRWVLDLAFGYGYPIFDFYPPLASYIAETLHIAGWGFAEAIKGTFILIIATAVTGAYKMGTELFDREQDTELIGLLTSVAFVFFPYSFINIYMRGALAEALAMALLPWLVWSLQRLLKRPTAAGLLLTAVFLALLLYAHSLTLLLAASVLGLMVLVEWLISHRNTQKYTENFRVIPCGSVANWFRVSLWLGGAAGLGAALGAAYWLPFIGELPLVKMGKGIPEIAGYFATTTHFFFPSTLIQFSLIYQYGTMALGFVPVALGICGVILAILVGSKLRERMTVFFFGAIAFVAALAILESSRPVWQQVPFATMVQYPWRVSSLIALSLAIVIGSLPVSVSKMSGRAARVTEPLTVLIVGAVLIVSAVAGLSPQAVYLPGGTPTMEQLAQFEKGSGFVGTTTFGEYMPNTVQVPDLARYAAPVDPRASRTDIQLVQDLPTRRVFMVSATEPVSVSLRALDFAGWQATVDNQPAAVRSIAPMGIVAVNVPSGTHQVTFSLENTPVQQIGNAISLVSVLFVLGACIWLIYRRASGAWAVVVVLGLGVLAFLVPTARALFAQPSATQPVNVTFSPELQAIGLGIDGARLDGSTWHIADSRAVQLRVEWQVKQSLPDQPFTWRLVDAQGHVAAENTQLSRYGTGAPAAWLPNEIVEDRYDIPLDAAMPAGRYSLQGKYGDRETFATLGNLVLEQSVAPSVVSSVYSPTDARFGDSIQLLGYDAPRLIQPGNRFNLTLYWKTERAVLDDDAILVQLFDVNDKVAAQLQYQGTQVASLRVPSLWTPGQTVRDEQNLTVPPTLKPGLYHWAVIVYRTSDGKRLDVSIGGNPPSDDVFKFGEVQVPMNVPDVKPQHALNAAVGQKIRLLGYDLAVTGKGGSAAASDNGNPPRITAAPGQALALQLYWQALADIGTDYKVFVHVQDQSGKLVAQQDGEPDEWRYPTRIWRAGERVADPHTLPLNPLPAGVYTVTLGMYAADTGERLPIVDANGQVAADGQVIVGTIEIRR